MGHSCEGKCFITSTSHLRYSATSSAKVTPALLLEVTPCQRGSLEGTQPTPHNSSSFHLLSVNSGGFSLETEVI